ncbi:MAG: DUF5663 domain-containing protein [Candidatus Wolfebacteria bacterium]|nr:DUF5663 domain-containing protein [Candidatus Wolfebacteria bacterium]
MDESIKKNIIKDIGLERFSPEKQEEMLLMIGKLIFQGVIVRVMALLNDKDKDDFDNLLMKNIEDEEMVLKFLESRIPNLDELVKEEIESFKKESADFMENLK